MPATAWVLKTGAHLWGLEHLLATYPDARIVFTHRDPVKSMTSYASLTAIVRRVGSDDVDPIEMADDWTARLRRVLLRGIEVRDAREYPDAVFYDMYFPDFIGDQFRVVEKIYEAFDLPMTDDGRRRMRAFIDDNPPGKHGIHRYAPEEFGVDPDRRARGVRRLHRPLRSPTAKAHDERSDRRRRDDARVAGPRVRRPSRRAAARTSSRCRRPSRARCGCGSRPSR